MSSGSTSDIRDAHILRARADEQWTCRCGDHVVGLVILAVLDFPIVLAGHGLEIGPQRVGEPRADDGSGGIETIWIVAAVAVAIVTAGLLVWLRWQDRGSRTADRSRRLRPRSMASIGLIAVVIAIPLIAWAAVSGDGGSEQSLIVERWTDENGAPELLVSLIEPDLNTLETTNGARAVRLTCVDRDGQVLLDADQEWPFVVDAGLEYPHVHQAASPEDVQRTNRCRLGGTSIPLEADVQDVLVR